MTACLFILKNSEKHREAVDNGYDIRMDEPEILQWMESYHKESSKELVEALSSFVKAVKNEDIIIHDNIDSDGFGSTVNFLYRQAEKALENHLKEHPTRTNEGSIN